LKIIGLAKSYNSPISCVDRVSNSLNKRAIRKFVMIRQGWPYFDGWPFQERWVQLDGLGIHYVDEGYGSRPVVMIHGNPAWSYMWRKLIPSVSATHRALALDLMGFGKSDKPNPLLHDFPHHARIVSGFIQSLGLRNIVLIVHDWGAPFAMQYVVRNPTNVSGLIIMNTFLTTDFRIPPNVAAKITPAIIKDSAVHPENITEEAMQAYWAPFPDDESKQVYQSFARMFPDSPFHPSFKPLKEIEQGVTHLSIPTLLLWGTAKTGTAYAEKVSKMIPDAKLSSLNAGHFVPEDDPNDVEKQVLEFLSSHNL
jgi:haloalkane dehalogenase